MNKTLPKTRGFTLIEMVVYVTIFVIVVGIVVVTTVGALRAFGEVSRFRALVAAGEATIGRLTYEIRDADTIDKNKSAFGLATGTLVIVKEDVDENATTSKFYLASDRSVQLVQTLSNANDSGGNGNAGGHHDPCVTNNDCGVDFPVCCAVPSHGPVQVCESPKHHGGICGAGVPPGVTATTTLTPLGNFVTGNIYVSKLLFRDLSATNSQAVKIELEVTASTGPRLIRASFYDTAVLRGSYK